MSYIALRVSQKGTFLVFWNQFHSWEITLWSTPVEHDTILCDWPASNLPTILHANDSGKSRCRDIAISSFTLLHTKRTALRSRRANERTSLILAFLFWTCDLRIQTWLPLICILSLLFASLVNVELNFTLSHVSRLMACIVSLKLLDPPIFLAV